MATTIKGRHHARQRRLVRVGDVRDAWTGDSAMAGTDNNSGDMKGARPWPLRCLGPGYFDQGQVRITQLMVIHFLDRGWINYIGEGVVKTN